LLLLFRLLPELIQMQLLIQAYSEVEEEQLHLQLQQQQEKVQLEEELVH
jgi:hypothetical protein